MYSLNYEKILASIKELNNKKIVGSNELEQDARIRILIQLPDGLKNRTLEIQEKITKEFPNIEILFWAGSNFGACDLPTGIDKLNIDMLLHFGHTEWVY